ncbi:Hypothetical protein GSB_154560, partial [Giardia duodenalis]
VVPSVTNWVSCLFQVVKQANSLSFYLKFRMPPTLTGERPSTPSVQRFDSVLCHVLRNNPPSPSASSVDATCQLERTYYPAPGVAVDSRHVVVTH